MLPIPLILRSNWTALAAACSVCGCSDIGTSDAMSPATTTSTSDGPSTLPQPALPDGSSGPALSPSSPTPGATSTPPGTSPNTTATTGPNPNSPPTAGDCAEAVVAPKRLVRLTFNQLANSVESLIGAELASELRRDFEIPGATERTFPPLNNPREGSVIIDAQWQTGDAIAERAAEWVVEHFDTLSSCGAEPSVECAQAYANTFAERAYRRPLGSDEQQAYSEVFNAAIAAQATVQEAVYSSVYAALSTPQFLYRTEFGSDAHAAGELSPHETASLLSYFLTDAPPDAELLDAAADGALVSPEQIDAQVQRLLGTPSAQTNLQAAMFSYFGISKLDTIVIDQEVAPSFTLGLRASMRRETELFINGTLWGDDVNHLLTERRSFVNDGLAELYGIPFPPPDASLDEDGFAAVTLPDTRSGILTLPGFLTTRSSPEKPSVVRRGLLVNATLLCATNPPFPEAQAEEIESVSAMLEDASEREKADFRATSPDCAGCHLIFDAYGLGLDNFDVIGAFRTTDPQMRPIDPSVTLPQTAGGQTVTSAAEMARELVDSGAFTRCVAKNLLAYALAEGSNIQATSCATRAVTEGPAVTDSSFATLVRGVARSTTFISRKAGVTQ